MCIYKSYSKSRRPDDRFMSSRTEGSSDINNSSLSVTLTDDLNGTLVECLDATVVDVNATGSYNICVIGLESAVFLCMRE